MKSLLFTFLLFLSSFVLAQKNTISYSAGATSLQGSTSILITPSNRILAFDSTQYISISQIMERTFILKEKIGAYGGFNIEFPLKGRATLSTGLHIQWLGFEYDADNFIFKNPPGGPDTTYFPISGLTTTIFTPCTYYTNQLPEAFSTTPQVNVFYLKIPIQLEIEPFENKMKVMGGLFFQTPIMTRIRTERTAVERTEETDAAGNVTAVACTYNHQINVDKTGNGFENLILGTHIGLSYRVWKQFWLEGVYAHSFRSMLTSNGPIPAVINHNWGAIHLGIRYRL